MTTLSLYCLSVFSGVLGGRLCRILLCSIRPWCANACAYNDACTCNAYVASFHFRTPAASSNCSFSPSDFGRIQVSKLQDFHKTFTKPFVDRRVTIAEAAREFSRRSIVTAAKRRERRRSGGGKAVVVADVSTTRNCPSAYTQLNGRPFRK